MNRVSKDNYYLDIAETVIGRATCLRRCYGAIIVKNDEIISTGYNGAPAAVQAEIVVAGVPPPLVRVEAVVLGPGLVPAENV